MRKKIVLGLLILVMGITAGCGQKASSHELTVEVLQDEKVDTKQEEKEEVDKTVDAKTATEKLNQFGLELLMKNSDTQNPVLSPLSAYLALHMVAEGAQENTLTEFEQVMGDLDTQRSLTQLTKESLNKYTGSMEFLLHNSAWIDDEFQVYDDWLAKALSFEGDQAFKMNLSSQKAVDEMNQWVEKNTNGLIKEMVDEPFEDLTRLVLFNALYMKGEWQNKFAPQSTYPRAFTLENGEEKDVDTMSMVEEKLSYIENEKLEGIVLPYKDSPLAFVAMKSKDEAKIRDLMKQTSVQELMETVQNRAVRNINLRLPSFDISFDQKLNDSLIDMGIVDAFDEDNANFRGIGTTDTGLDIYVSLVRQKARITVDEEGTEAAAVTEIAMVECTRAIIEEEPAYDLFFDQPFFYMIMDLEKNMPIFMGFLDDPMTN